MNRFATTYRTKDKVGKSGSETKLHLLRSYDHELNSDSPMNNPVYKPATPINFGLAENMVIWDVARAATAAPMYFKELAVKHDGIDNRTREKVYYSDGGFGHTNNPTHLGIEEFGTLHQQNGNAGGIGAIVSIGTARADSDRAGRSFLKRVQKAFDAATDPQIVANLVRFHHRTHWRRLNDSEGLDVELDDWKPNKFSTNPGHETLTRVKNGFLRWAHNRDNIDMIHECARELVRRRTSRALDRSKWERFATAAEFKCGHPRCRNERFDSRHRFDDHFEENMQKKLPTGTQLSLHGLIPVKKLADELGQALKKEAASTCTFNGIHNISFYIFKLDKYGRVRSMPLLRVRSMQTYVDESATGL